MTVAIAGAAESDLGDTGASVLGLHAQAVTRALHDAGLALSEVDGIATTGVSRFSATQLADYLGVQPSWTDSTFAGGSAFEMFVARAAQAIEAGQCGTVLIAFASNQRSARSRSLGGAVEPHTPEAIFESPYAPLYPISYYAMAAQRYVHVYKADREQIAEVAVAAREWALRNPKAFRYGAGPLTAAGVLDAPMISTPLTSADCCLVTDGGGAVVLTSLERARDLRRPPVVVLGYGESTTNTSMTSADDLLRPGSFDSGRRAFAMAGLAPSDVDVAEVYDSFTVTVLLTLEGLGFCAPGDAAGFIAGGRTRPGGDFPLNTNGGGLSYCHPGQYGLLLLVEAVRQLRGECGDRQVDGAEVALAHGTGGILSSHATVLLGADR
ncbi:acetyl-CoA acetyltransferase [Actinomadura opuntiae]|uniref:acetyl-CoA acetyltransferase n=1 Tax=Actinomadura sp. OS1-43 TaxID=604315 RepID=UPI00255ADE90|nr:acetyl-CoA acetyltransferase [Actinomadura sp. OS1-43]MDL4813228.1 acetyl-CoA acetyltransferase [Actinomadura sp. OS1-43]